MQKKRPTMGRTSLPRCRITGTTSVYQRPEKRQHNPSSPKENPSKQERDKRQSRKRPRVRRSGPKNAKSMRYNAPAYGTWVLSDYITAGKQPACFHYATLARTKAHTFGTFCHPDPNSTGCLDPEARHRPDHSDSIASGWPQRGNICPEATSPIGLLGCSRNFRVAAPSFESRLLPKRLIERPMTDVPGIKVSAAAVPSP